MTLKHKKPVHKNRSSLDIVCKVLSIASVKVRKTRIMYGANLSFLQLEKYLSTLLGSGLLASDDSSYLVTGSGIKFLQQYEDHLKRSRRLKMEVEDNTKDRQQLEIMCGVRRNDCK